ncbi:MAG TPA: 3D domain-containing protein [Syntrophomonadaceae bacterium]|nr:3D domain-containing protein [Syntrophomonadaceae bacterium]HQA07005.1 3D domain-containing protein [Syntrophomonadaceae bacterium]HQE23860.1 3D domain-containing protein [Syntrophomonadaceae bacterium]
MGIVRPRKGPLAATLVFMVVLLVSLFFALQKPVILAVDGQEIQTRVFFSSTVGDVLQSQKVSLGEYDRVEPSLNSKVKKNQQIVVTRAFKVKVIADGNSREIITPPIPVKEAISLAGVELGAMDIVKTMPTEVTVPNQEIEIIRVSQEEKVIEEATPFQVERTEDHTLERGLTRTIKPGVEGLARNTVRITYHNGQEVKREIVKSEVVKEPQNKVIAMGTITSVSRGGENLNFREARYMTASAYTYTGRRTATGQQPAVGMVAVDPTVIPLGTRMYVEGYGYAVAADTGGSIRGNQLDLFMEERSQCINWGRRTVKVYILN